MGRGGRRPRRSGSSTRGARLPPPSTWPRPSRARRTSRRATPRTRCTPGKAAWWSTGSPHTRRCPARCFTISAIRAGTSDGWPMRWPGDLGARDRPVDDVVRRRRGRHLERRSHGPVLKIIAAGARFRAPRARHDPRATEEERMRSDPRPRLSRPHARILVLLAVLLVLGAGGRATAQIAPAGEAVMAWHVIIAPSWFDPSTAPPQIT